MIGNGDTGEPIDPSKPIMQVDNRTIIVPFVHPEHGQIRVGFKWRQIKAWAAQIMTFEASAEEAEAQARASRIVKPEMQIPRPRG